MAKHFRRNGITVELLQAAVDHVRRQGGKIVEGYPVDVKDSMAASSLYTGIASVFQQAGFYEVARRTPTRPIFRFIIEE